jgi:hypothetical protein
MSPKRASIFVKHQGIIVSGIRKLNLAYRQVKISREQFNILLRSDSEPPTVISYWSPLRLGI